ncbi:MAG: hypothetical protein IT390_05260 [Nitrospira sp.]|nr:hypothetical protein [Nitrospira sp.]
MSSAVVIIGALACAAAPAVAPANVPTNVSANVPTNVSANVPGAATAQAPAGTPEPQVKRTVLEDDHVRIEELKVRGQVQRITVSPKASGVRPYEIVPPGAGHDPSQPSKGLSGQRLWRLLSF